MLVGGAHSEFPSIPYKLISILSNEAYKKAKLLATYFQEARLLYTSKFFITTNTSAPSSFHYME